jgi:hypothetical protein
VTGNANISSANYTIGIQVWPGTPLNALNPPFDNPVEDVTNDPAPIDTSLWPIGSYQICVYGNDELGNNNTTGSCAILTIAPELIPPGIFNVLIDGSATQFYTLSSMPATFFLNATIDDELFGNSFIGNVTLGGANYTIGPANWPSSQPMSAVDGTWEDNVAEDVTVTVATPTSAGVYVYCVYGWDQWFNFNTTGLCATLTIIDDLPPEVHNLVLNGLPTLTIALGAGPVWVNATIDDTATGNTDIQSANYTIGAQNWPGASMSAVLAPFDNPVEAVTSIPPIDTTDTVSWPVGNYDICVYGSDALGNNNVTGDCAQLNINPAVDLPPTIEAWEPGGTPGQTYTQGDVIIVTWTASDDNPLPATPINITYGVPGSWTDIASNEANDGSYSWNTGTVTCPGTYWMNLSVYDSSGQTTFDLGNNSFDIFCPGDSPPIITAWEPGGTSGQTYTRGDTITVTWTANDDNPLPANPINITYGAAAPWTGISYNEANDGSYDWDTSGVACPGTYWMNLSVRDSIGQTTFDRGNFTFDIECPPTEPPVVVSVVADPDRQTVGQTVTITAVVTDADTDLDELTVTVEIRTPEGSLLGEFPMTFDQGNGTFTYSSSFELEGTYSYTVTAADPDDNSDSESDAFAMTVPEPREEYNWKPIIALLFTIILLLFGLLVSYKRPYRFKGELQKDRMYTFLIGVLPFAITEASTGIISLVTGLLSVPPILGVGMIVDLAILMIGLIVIFVIFKKGSAAMMQDETTPVAEEDQPDSPGLLSPEQSEDSSAEPTSETPPPP